MPISRINKVEQLLSIAERKTFDRWLRSTKPSGSAAQRWLAERGHHTSITSVRRYMLRRELGVRGPAQMFLKVDKVLKEEDRAPYATLLSNPCTNRDSAQAWLKERGYDVGCDAVARHHRRFRQNMIEVRRSAGVAQALGSVIREGGAGAIAEVALTRFEQLVMEQLLRADIEVDIPPRDLSELAKSVTAIVGNRGRVESQRQDFEDRARRAAQEVDRAAKSSGNSADLCNRVRQILGVPIQDSDSDNASPPPPPRLAASLARRVRLSK